MKFFRVTYIDGTTAVTQRENVDQAIDDLCRSDKEMMTSPVEITEAEFEKEN